MIYSIIRPYYNKKRYGLMVRRMCDFITNWRFRCLRYPLPYILILLFVGSLIVYESWKAQTADKAILEDFRNYVKKNPARHHPKPREFIPQPPVFKDVLPVVDVFKDKDQIIDVAAVPQSTENKVDSLVKKWQSLYLQQKENLFFLIGNKRSHLATALKFDKTTQEYEDMLDLNLFQLSQLEQTKTDFSNLKTQEFLVNYVQKVIEHNQNPEKCENIEVLSCDIHKACGFACIIHHILHCFTTALGEGKPMLVSAENFHGFSSFHEVIKPLSRVCSLNMEKTHNLAVKNIPIIEHNVGNTYLPPVVPTQILNHIDEFHAFPFLWWMGQLISYLFRFQPDILKKIKIEKFTTPIIGVHVRRTDKIGTEAEAYSVEEYMFWVDLFNRKLDIQGKPQIKNVYVATDEIGLIKEFRTKYPNYIFISNENATAESNFHRDDVSGTLGILSDIYHLSMAEYLVCTFSSQVCRLAYEWMNTRRVDATNDFHSLDEIYYFGGQMQRDFNLKINHTSKEKFFDTKYKFNLRHNDWNGYSGIEDLKTLHQYHVPSFKIKENWLSVDFHAFKNYEKSIGKK